MIAFKGRTRNILLVIGGIITLFLIWYFSAIVTYIIISVVLSFIGRPVVKKLQKIKIGKFSVPDGLAAFIALIFIWVVFVGFFRFMIPLLVSEFDTLSSLDFNAVLESIQEPISRITKFVSGKSIEVNGQTFFDVLQEQLSSRFEFSQLSNVVGFVAGTLGELMIAFFSISFITFFFLKEKDMFRNAILLIVPTEVEKKVGKILSSISYLLRRYFIGLLFEVFMVMLLDTIGLTIIGIEFQHAVVIGLFCGLFNVIPYLGPWMGAFVGILIGVAINLNADFMSHTLPLLGWMVVVFGSVQVIDNILFQPLIYSSSVKAHPLEIFLVIMAAGSMAGILGMILAIPSYTILRVIAKEFFDNMKIVKKLTENLGAENNKISDKKHK
ncbi:MAG: AI-2E family transporter [Prolixibacteraceae bacterium]|nr:AI-2E family transporter [Prolixibacteraceae bacterium]MBN2774643.1 AI-2E family transporter [Prolixibacteraceae bacterium]